METEKEALFRIIKRMQNDGLIPLEIPKVTFYIGNKPPEDECQD
jgi:hypothetical protein